MLRICESVPFARLVSYVFDSEVWSIYTYIWIQHFGKPWKGKVDFLNCMVVQEEKKEVQEKAPQLETMTAHNKKAI